MDGQTTDLAWLAGFIDAEGWFGVMRRQRTYRSGVLNVRYRPAIQVGNTDEGTWPVVTTILDRWGLAYNEYMRTHNGVQWSVEVRGSLRCAAWIDVLLPYLRVKQADARLLREYCTFVLEHPNAGSAGRAYSAREQEILALFGVEPTMAVRPPLRTRSPLLAAEPVLFDPQALSPLDLAWLGGFFDGEGSIYLWTFRRRGVQYQLPAVAINNTHMPVLPYVRVIMDAHGLGYRCQPSIAPPQERRLPYWKIETVGVTRTEPWLRLLLPYLHTKRGQAEDMLDYCRQNPGRNPAVSAADKTRIRAMYATGSYTQQQLADLFGICYATVNRIVAQDRPAGALYHSPWRRVRARRKTAAADPDGERG